MIPTARTACIVNPVAGKGRSMKIWTAIERVLEARGGDYECLVTPGPKTVYEVTRRAVAEGFERLVAIGGDGTVQEAANAVACTGLEFGIVPAGTGNDFARTLGLPGAVEDLAEMILDGSAEDVDLGRIDGEYFANIAGCGIDAVIADRVNRGRVLVNGTITYLVTAVSTLLSYRSPRMRVTVDGESIEDELLLVAVGNGKYYGGGIKMVPPARVDDGLFHVVVVRALSRPAAIRLLPLTYSGRHVEHPRCSIHRGRRVRIECDTPLPIQADGNITGALPAEFEVVPAALKVLMPRRR